MIEVPIDFFIYTHLVFFALGACLVIGLWEKSIKRKELKNEED